MVPTQINNPKPSYCLLRENGVFAVYLNKSTDPAKLAKRIEELVSFILAEYEHK
jgi:hypothetical protein